MPRLLLSLLLLITFLGCAAQQKADFCIQNATIFLYNGDTLAGQSILIAADTILAIVPTATTVIAAQTIDAHGKLVTPGLLAIDEHLDDVFGDAIGRLSMQVDSFEAYRSQFAATYLPYGVTTVRTAGDAEEWLAMALHWMRNPAPDAPDFFPSGGSMVSPYAGSRYVNHCFLADSLAARYKMAAYHALGIRHIKLYGNLHPTTFVSALRAAERLQMTVSAQVQNLTCYDSTLGLGLRNFEQVATLFYDRSVLDFWGDATFNATMAHHWADSTGTLPQGGSRIYPFLEAARFVGRDNPKVMRLLRQMKALGAGMVPCLHFFAQWLGKTWHCSQPKAERFDVSGWTPAQLQRCREGYDILAHTTFQMWEMGIPLRMGTDHRDGGRAVLSEMLLLHAAGIPMRDVLLIATRNSATAIGLSDQLGTIEVGKKAHLIIFEGNPLIDAKHLLGPKTVIKSGRDGS